MKTKYGFFARIKDSIAGPTKITAYVDENAKAKGGGHLALLSLIGVLLSLVTMLIALYPMGRIHQAVSYIPDFELKNGVLEMDIDEPLIYDAGYTVFIAEQGGNSGIAESYLGYQQVAYINSAGMLFKNNGEIQSLNWSELDDVYFSKVEVENIALKWTWVVFLCAAPFMFLFVWIGDLFFALIASLAGLIINAICKTQLTYGKIFKLSIYAMTTQKLLGILLEIIRNLIPAFSFSISTFWNFVITVGFLVLYFVQYKKANTEIEQLYRQKLPTGNPTGGHCN